jgi:hypothetical protein
MIASLMLDAMTVLGVRIALHPSRRAALKIRCAIACLPMWVYFSSQLEGQNKKPEI